jgi:type III secretory pathway lipoprotein EscJ
MIEHEKLLFEYNRRASDMLIERIKMNDLNDMIELLVNSSILQRKLHNKKKHVMLDVELSELSEALKNEKEEEEFL